jgi:hypothetical protein
VKRGENEIFGMLPLPLSPKLFFLPSTTMDFGSFVSGDGDYGSYDGDGVSIVVVVVHGGVGRRRKDACRR